MPALVEVSTVDTHPQRDAIIRDMLEGKPMASIAHWVKPPVSRATLSRYRLKVLATAIEPLRSRGAISRSIKDVGSVMGLSGDVDAGRANVVEQARTSITKTLEGLSTRRFGWMSDAEEKPLLDALGMPIIINGKPLTNLDHRALAAHDRNTISALDLQAKIAGAYAEGTTNVSVTNVVMIPAGRDPDSALPVISAPGAAGEVLDITAADECSDMDPLQR
jgi:hypothetical protein